LIRCRLLITNPISLTIIPAPTLKNVNEQVTVGVRRLDHLDMQAYNGGSGPLKSISVGAIQFCEQSLSSRGVGGEDVRQRYRFGSGAGYKRKNR